MSENPNIKNHKSIYDELHLIYKNNDHITDKTEHITNPVSARLYYISDSITKAREDFLEAQSTHHETIKRNYFSAIVKHLFNQDKKLEIATETSLRRKEYAIGAKLYDFGVPNERQEFFNDNRTSWYYYVEKNDSKGNVIWSETAHFEVHPTEIRTILVKNGRGIENQGLDEKSLNHFILATNTYHELVLREVYGIQTTPDKKAQ